MGDLVATRSLPGSSCVSIPTSAMSSSAAKIQPFAKTTHVHLDRSACLRPESFTAVDNSRRSTTSKKYQSSLNDRTPMLSICLPGQ